MRKILLPVVSFILALAFPAFADVPQFVPVKEKSFLKFFAIMNNAPVQGKFDSFTADIRFDPEHTDQSSIEVTVDMASASGPNDDVTTNIKLPEWLSTELFPKAVFKSTKIIRTPSTNNYYAEGSLTLRDKTEPVTLNFTMDRYDDKGAIANGYLTLRRTDFGVGQGQWAKDDVVKDTVRVEFRLFADRK